MSAGLCVLAHNKVKGKKLTLKKGKVLGLCKVKKPFAANNYSFCKFVLLSSEHFCFL